LNQFPPKTRSTGATGFEDYSRQFWLINLLIAHDITLLSFGYQNNSLVELEIEGK